MHVDNDRLRLLCGISRDGSSLFRLQEAAEQLGFVARLRSLDLHDLRDHAKSYLPVIVALQTGTPLHHFVTIYRIRGDRVLVMDPTVGFRDMDFDELLARIVTSELPYRPHNIKREEESSENSDELFGKLVAHGVSRDQAERWIDRHSLFFIDDCLKYVELTSQRIKGRALGSPRNVLIALLEMGTYRLPGQFGTVVRYDEQRSVMIVTGPAVLEIKGRPSPEFAARESRGPKRRLLELLAKHWRGWAPQALISACLGALGLAMAAATGLVVQSFDTGWPPLLILLLALGCAQVVGDYARFANTRSMARLTNIIQLRAKSGLLQNLAVAPERRLRDRSTGEMVARVEESGSLAAFLSEWGIGTAVGLATAVVAVVLVARVFWPFLAVALAQVVVGILVVELFSRRLRQLARDVYERSTLYNAKLLEILRGLEAVRLVRAGNYIFYDADRLSSSLTQSTFRQQDWMIWQQLVLGLSGVAATTAMVLAGYSALSHGTATVASITSALALTAYVQGSLSGLLGRRQTLESNGVALDRYEELAAHDRETGPPAGAAKVRDSHGRHEWSQVELEGISFSYRRDRPVLRGLDLSFGRGETICLLGASGTGKSTLFDVITGLHELAGGEIRVDGKVHSSPSTLGFYLVHQEPALIHGTLLDNVAFGRPVPPDDVLSRATRAAGIGPVIDRLPDGWNTKVGGRWSSLSGGERRRLCLCRALVRAPTALLLDETLGALEPELRRAIIAELHRFDPRMTIIMITHDAQDAVFCSRAIVMAGGVVVEDGPASELLRNESTRVFRLAQGGAIA